MYVGVVFGYYGVIEIKKVTSIKFKGYALIIGEIGIDENWITFYDTMVQGLVTNVNAIESVFWTKVRSQVFR